MLLFILLFLSQYARKKFIPSSKWGSPSLEIGAFENRVYTLLSFDLPPQVWSDTPHRVREINGPVPPENNTGQLFLFYSAMSSRCWDICQIISQKNCSHAGPRWHLATVAIRTWFSQSIHWHRLFPQSPQKIYTVFCSLCCLVMFPEFLISIVVWLPVAHNVPSRKN